MHDEIVALNRFFKSYHETHSFDRQARSYLDGSSAVRISNNVPIIFGGHSRQLIRMN